jgi:hypothetical protein
VKTIVLYTSLKKYNWQRTKELLGYSHKKASIKLIFTCFFFSIICSCNNRRIETSFTQKDIIENLEMGGQETYHSFIDFEHPYFYTAGSRLTLFADKKRWAIVFEKSGYGNRSYQGEIELSYFGNCLTNFHSPADLPDMTSNVKWVTLITDKELQRLSEDSGDLVSKNVQKIRVRDSILDIEHDKKVYEKNAIQIRSFDNPDSLIDVPSLVRYLQEQHPNLFFATDNELRECVPSDLPMLMHIDQWHHKTYSRDKHMTSPTDFTYEIDGTSPNEYETYKIIADILVSKNISLWKPSLKPNNNWRNWPHGGEL